MKRFFNTAYLPVATLTCGVVTYLLRTLLWISAMGAEDSALLPAGTWPDVMSWVFVALMVVLLGAGTWKMQGSNKYSTNFPASLPAAVGMVLAAVGFTITSVTDFSAQGDSVNIVSAALGFIASLSLFFLAYCRFKGLHPNMIFHGVVCLYLMLHLVSHYRLWSSYPQLQSYAFELMAIVFIMLACYHRAAFDAGKGKFRAYTFFSLMALFFCIATLPGCDNPVFFLGCAVWMFCTPCRLSLPTKKEE